MNYSRLKKCLLQGIVVLSIWLGFISPSLAEKIEDMAVLVSSCDRYASLWYPFFQLWEKYWPNLNNDVYLMSGHLQYASEKVKPIQVGVEKSWSDSMMMALEQIPENYVLLTLDDYFLEKPVDHQMIATMVALMQQEDIGFISLFPLPVERTHLTESRLGYMAKTQPYRTSLNVGIWRKSTLLSLLKSGENPWLFEIHGSVRSRDIVSAFMSVTKEPMRYFNATNRGKLMPQVLDLLRIEKISAKDLNLPVMGTLEQWYRGPFRHMIAKYIGTPLRKITHFDGNFLPESW